MASYRLGVDVGGTFTDLVLLDIEGGRAYLHKVPSTPGDQSVGIMQGIVGITTGNGVAPGDVAYLGHGTTVATNAVIEERWAPTALITTQGFRDIIEIRRQQRLDAFDLSVVKPPQIAPRQRRLEVDERTDADGQVQRRVDLAQLAAVLERLRAAGAESVAVCFLHSYLNPENERVVRDFIAERFPELYVTASHELVPEFREYPRVSTTLVNAGVGPVISRYLGNFANRVREAGITVEPHIMQSNGGVMSVQAAGRAAVKTLSSGPCAGVIGAIYVAELAGEANLVTFDVGGTSTDICLVSGGVPLMSLEKAIAGYPIRLPMLDVPSIGAGGGSLAWVDSGGFLQVGPRSAGAQPGPACYGRGGTRPTVTDANVVLGRLNPTHLLNGRMSIDAPAAWRSLEEHVASKLGVGVVEAAAAILTVVNSNIARAIRLISVQRGHDPRDFVLMPFGGAGPLHAVEVARELGFQRILVPLNPGILCALGLLVSDIRSDFSRTRLFNIVAADPAAVDQVFAELEDQARAWLSGEGVPPAEQHVVRVIDMRYAGQSHELPVPAPAGRIGPEALDELARRFRAEHVRLYGYESGAATELVTFRLTAMAPVARPNLRLASGGGSLAAAQIAERPVFFEEATGFVACPVYDRNQLAPGCEFDGPAVCEQLDSTTVLPPGSHALVDEFGNLNISLD